MMAGVKMLHVPYRGGTPAIADLIGGQVHVYFASMGGGSIEHVGWKSPSARGYVDDARRRATRNPVMADFLPGYEATSWLGVVAPKNTPTDIIEKLHKEINVGLIDPKMKARFAELGFTVLPGSQD